MLLLHFFQDLIKILATAAAIVMLRDLETLLDKIADNIEDDCEGNDLKFWHQDNNGGCGGCGCAC